MLFSLQRISAFLYLRTPDSTLALCLGAILNREITPKMPPNVALNILQNTHTHTHTHTHTLAIWTLKQGSSVAPVHWPQLGMSLSKDSNFLLICHLLQKHWELIERLQITFSTQANLKTEDPQILNINCIRHSLTKTATSTLLPAFSPLLIASPSYHLAGLFQLPSISHLIFSSNSPRLHLWYKFLSFCYEKWYIQGNPSRDASNKWLHKISHNSKITAFPVTYCLSFLRLP